MSSSTMKSRQVSNPLPAPISSSHFSPPSTSSTFSSSSSSSSALTSQLRSLIFHGSLTLCITLSSSPSASSTVTATQSFYIQAPRISYLPLLLPSIKGTYLPLVTDDVVDEDKVWFDYNGIPLKWHWPIGLLFDYHTANLSLSTPTSPPTSTSNPTSLASYFTPPPPTSTTTPAAAPTKADQPSTFNLTMHLKDPPGDALLMGNGVEVCRTGFMHMLKEADFVRCGSVKRVNNLRKEQQDSLWEGVVQNDYSKFWSTASRLVPPPTSSSSSSTDSPSLSRSSTPDTGSDLNGTRVRSVPIRVYLPDSAPVLQGVIPPVGEDGKSTTLLQFLTTVVPLFFPSGVGKVPLAKAIVQGVEVPLETEVGWLGSVLAGADGWVAVVLVIEGRR